jgi:diaminohydroxyphosphoribosylaminopyrimidine deaminase/5-amino-6-(5-phosphoribosylamino)uracil reductase
VSEAATDGRLEPRDDDHMAAALRVAARGLGNVWPNPAVGCVIVKHGRVVGRGWTQPGGRPHAETEALRRAGAAARGATAYVTLEPCSHHGQTPPCADALIAAGIARCVVATGDPDSRVAGRGLARLRAAGMAVTEGVLARPARALNAGFFLRQEAGRPLVTLKLATSLDGRIALANGASKWITGPEARAMVHLERARHDAVLTGAGTVRADDPDLRCRLDGVDPRPVVRVVLAGRGDLATDGALLRSVEEAPLWLICGRDAAAAAEARLAPLGVRVFASGADAAGRLSPVAVLEALAAEGITRVMVEAGGRLAASCLAAGVVDRLLWFRAPLVIGGDGVAAVAALGLDRLAESPDFATLDSGPVGRDWYDLFERG